MSALRKILLADDDPEIREVVALVLEPHGIETLVAANGNEAIDLIKKNADIELVLADLMMPGLSGTEMMTILKGDQNLCRIPVVVLSGDNLAIELARRHGAAECLRKPVDLAHLLATIRKFVGS